MIGISNSYPSDITNPENIYRSIKILVKNVTSLSGSVDALIAEANAARADIENIISTKNKNPSTEEQKDETADRTKKLTNAETVWGIALPLPNELNDSQSHQWDTTKGIIGEVGGGLADTSFGPVSVNKALGELASKSGFRKPIIDPGYFQDYNGTEPREFSFTWDLIPNNVEEAKQIEHILYNLKKYTLPTTTINKISLLSPYIFDIEIGNPIINRLMNMNNLVCRSMSINYSAEGALQFLPDGIPKYMRLEMTFAERALVTSEFY